VSRRGRRRRSGRNDDILQGVLLVDKPAGMTSREVCEFVRGRLRLGKAGHGGTLDPFATGLLPLLLNGATRLMPSLQDQEKVYRAVFRLGVRTDTMDLTGEVTGEADPTAVTDDQIAEALTTFVGEITQTIPRYAAARVDGKRLYEYAREGEEVELPTKEVVIYSLDLLGVERGEGVVDVEVQMHCGPGTYVRAVADDFGELLGVGAHVHSLRRLQNGGLLVDGAVTLDAIDERAGTWRDERKARQEAEGAPVRFEPEENAQRWGDFLGAALIPVAQLLGGLTTLRMPDDVTARVRSGQPLRKGDMPRCEPVDVAFRPGDRLVVEDASGLRGIAVMRATCSSDSLPRREESAVVLDVERVLR